ncbi:GntR family transcriptional regulator [Brachybacterium phenoliresistens]|uniref:GntR family transcriptional regulator n=1 Tax=Brachybacterium phenoliresistens TaxID=396014 RepID=Z9JWU9_9MICO|nr:GntR family transcriptional regulator [Brachybacterium phenoliresistens]
MDGLVAVDRGVASPPVRQIQVCLSRAIQAGTLPPGTRLPTVRALAADLGVAVNTVAKAFRRLEEAGLVMTRGRAGTVVSPLDDVSGRIESAAREYAVLATELGLSHEDALAQVHAELRTLSAVGG